MKFAQAIEIMTRDERETDEQLERRARAVDAIVAAVSPLCATGTNSEPYFADPERTTMQEWVDSGAFSGQETPESIAAEWDSLA